jgi:hypothetical protein
MLAASELVLFISQRRMSSETSSPEIQRALQSAVECFTPTRMRFKCLLPFKDEIERLRGKGASFDAIAEILRQHHVTVSHEWVRLFYRESIEKNGHKRKTRNHTKTSAARNGKTYGAIPKRLISNGPPQDKSERGPRIANVNEL